MNADKKELSFSQRKGLKPVKTAFQIESMDNELRNGLWNALTIYYWDKLKKMCRYHGLELQFDSIPAILQLLWLNFFKDPLDSLTPYYNKTYDNIRNRFYQYPWYTVYDFMEFIAQNSNNDTTKVFTSYCNQILERECSAYRFVGNTIAEITSQPEISEIEEALKKSDPLKGVHTHLQSALAKMSDRQNPDYRNSIKESISAVESLARLITKKPKATLGDALKEIESKKTIKIHGALKEAFEKIYGYTSDEAGIRHALIDESELDFSDAKYMLVACSAFVNYLIDKAGKSGISISG